MNEQVKAYEIRLQAMSEEILLHKSEMRNSLGSIIEFLQNSSQFRSFPKSEDLIKDLSLLPEEFTA